MFNLFSQRLLTVLQLTRMALVFTAISNSLCALMIWARWNAGDEGSLTQYITPLRAAAVAMMSLGLYGFGMALNDINDRRRDSQLASHRPLPSGRIGVFAAHAVCAVFALGAIIGGLLVARFIGAEDPRQGLLSFILLVWTGVLITFYDFAGKYLVAPGLLTLGLIRFFHATIAEPRLPLLWHPLLLLNHVTIISLISYRWEAKRPPLTRIHWWAVLGGLALVDVLCVALVGWRRMDRTGGGILEALWIDRRLIWPGVAVAAFVVLATLVHRVPSRRDTRRAGQSLMLYGLLWLIVYDATFAAAYASTLGSVLLLLLLPMSYFSVQFMRWWGKIVSLSQTPQFQRVR